jgi:ankyrin repeat protein
MKRSHSTAICLIATMSVVLALPYLAHAAAPSLADAAMQGDIRTVRELLKQKVDVNVSQGDGMTALHWAAFRDNLEMARLLVQAGASVKTATRIGGITPLFMACNNGSVEMIQLLLGAGADATAVNTVNGSTPLMAAATSGNAQAVTLLLDRGAQVNVKETGHGQTAIMFAAAFNRPAVVEILASKGADLNAMTPVEDLTSRPKYDENGNLIKPDPNAAVASGAARGTAAAMGGMTALLFAARDGQIDAAKALVKAGADLNLSSGAEHTSPLVMAFTNARFDVGKYLLDQGADPNIPNVYGLTALYAAIDAEYAPHSWAPAALTTNEHVTLIEVVRDLLDRGADPNAKLVKKLWYRPTSHGREWIRPEGSSPFWRAAMAADPEAMRLLVQRGANPRTPSDDGDTPVMMAAGVGWIPGNFSQTAPDPKAWLNAVKYCIEELGLEINTQDKLGYTALHGASWRANHEVIQYLVEKGARLDLANKKNEYVSDMANGVEVNPGGDLPLEKPETVALLVKLGAPVPKAPKATDGVVKKQN